MTHQYIVLILFGVDKDEVACVPDHCHTRRNFQMSLRYLFSTMKSLVQAKDKGMDLDRKLIKRYGESCIFFYKSKNINANRLARLVYEIQDIYLCHVDTIDLLFDLLCRWWKVKRKESKTKL